MSPRKKHSYQHYWYHQAKVARIVTEWWYYLSIFQVEIAANGILHFFP